MSIWINKKIDENCFLPGISFSGVLPQDLDDDMLCCNNSMITIDTKVCMTSFYHQFWQDSFYYVSCEQGNQSE